MRILITGSGGAAAISFTRSVKENYTIGIDCNPYTLHRSETSLFFLCPRANDPSYFDFLNKIIDNYQIKFVHFQPEAEIRAISNRREELHCPTFLPGKKSIKICTDKARSWEIWRKAGIKVPEQLEIKSYIDLKTFYRKFRDVWIRERVGAAGKGSLKKPSYTLAKAWIDARDGWGNYIAAECLTDRTTTYQSLWNMGNMVAGQGRERLYWEAGNRTQSGVTGITGTGKIVNDPELTKLAIKCIKAIDDNPHGIWSVDFTYDHNGIPNPTEINIGKFFTTHYFLTLAGCNMPQMMLDIIQNKPVERMIDKCKEGMLYIRGMDVEPKFISEEIVDGYLARS